MSLHVDNCPNCGAVFQKNLRNLCPSCSSQIDADIDCCIKYLWKHPNATTKELSEATQIHTSVIIKYIKQGKLSRSYNNLTYPCECCGKQIRDNRLCFSCAASFKEIANQINTAISYTRASAYKINESV